MSEKNVKAVILAAGKGTRMKSDLPKVLHQIFNKPLLSYIIEAVNNSDYVSENFIIVGHEANIVEDFVSKNYSNSKCVLQKPQLGTGDAVRKVCPYLNDFNGHILVICGDTPLITTETINTFIKFHNQNNNDITVMSAIFDNPTNYGRIIRDNDGNLKAIVEEKDTTIEQKQIKEINAGIYCINYGSCKNAFNELKNNNAQGEYYLTDIIQWAVNKGLKVQSHILQDKNEIYGINSKLNLAEVTKMLNQRTINKLLTDGVTIVDPATTFISPETTIEADTIILPNVYITGKNTIGKHCSIGPFSHIRGGAVIGNNVRIGNFVEIKKSVIKDNTNVSHLSYIGDSELGTHVNIGAGTITANYDPVLKVKTKTIIKDGANTGSNSVLVAPVTINENALVAAGSVVSKDIEPYALAITRNPLKIVSNWVKNKLQLK